MAYITKRLSDEDRKYWEEVLKKAVPYTKEEMDELLFDGEIDEESLAREDAYMAQRYLEEDDELRARGL